MIELPLTYSCSFLTAKNDRPLVVEIQLLEIPRCPSGWRINQYRLYMVVSGAEHPYDPYCASGFYGDANRNPALLPAVHFLQEHSSDLVRKGLSSANISIQSLDTGGAENIENGRALARAAPCGFTLILDVNPEQPGIRPENHVPASLGQLQNLFQFVTKNLENVGPDIQSMIHANRDKEPPQDPVQTMAHQSNIALIATKAAMQAGWAIAAEPDDIEPLKRIAHKAGLQKIYLAQRTL